MLKLDALPFPTEELVAELTSRLQEYSKKELLDVIIYLIRYIEEDYD